MSWYEDINFMRGLICKICHRVYHDPKILDCGRSCCAKCVIKVFNIETDKDFFNFQMEGESMKCNLCGRTHALWNTTNHALYDITCMFHRNCLTQDENKYRDCHKWINHKEKAAPFQRVITDHIIKRKERENEYYEVCTALVCDIDEYREQNENLKKRELCIDLANEINQHAKNYDSLRRTYVQNEHQLVLAKKQMSESLKKKFKDMMDDIVDEYERVNSAGIEMEQSSIQHFYANFIAKFEEIKAMPDIDPPPSSDE